MVNCFRNIRVKNYENLISLLQATIKIVRDFFETRCNIDRACMQEGGGRCVAVIS